MTQNPGPTAGPTNQTHPDGHASGLDRFFGWIRSVDLRRDGDDKWLAGVCSGIASRLGVDPIVIRAVLVLLVVLGGVGITVYLIAWAFLPNNREEIIAEKALRDGDVLGIILLVVIGLSLIGGAGLTGDNSGLGWIWWVIVPVGLVVWLVTRNRDGHKNRAAAGQPAYGPPPATYVPPSVPYTAAPAQTSALPENPTNQTQEYAAVSSTTYAPAPGATPPGATPPMATPPGGGYGPPPVPVAPRPRPPKAPRRRSGGFVATLLVGGLALAAYGATLSIHDAANWAGSDETVALAAALAVLGLGTLVLGLLGRRAGFTGFLAVVLALVTWTASVVPDVTFGGGIGERTWRPSVTDTTERYRLSIGSAELDLENAPDNPGTAREIEARVGIGELRIYIPDNLTVEVRSSVAAGDISRMGTVRPRPDRPARGRRRRRPGPARRPRRPQHQHRRDLRHGSPRRHRQRPRGPRTDPDRQGVNAMAKPDAPQNDPQDDTTFDTTAGDSTADETTQLEQTVPSDTQQFNETDQFSDTERLDTSDATRAIGVDEQPTTRDLFGNPVDRADDQPVTVATHGSGEQAAALALPPRPSGPHAPAIVLGLVVLTVAGIILAQELGDLTPDWGDIGPFGIVVTGAVLVLFGLVGLLTSRRNKTT